MAIGMHIRNLQASARSPKYCIKSRDGQISRVSFLNDSLTCGLTTWINRPFNSKAGDPSTIKLAERWGGHTVNSCPNAKAIHQCKHKPEQHSPQCRSRIWGSRRTLQHLRSGTLGTNKVFGIGWDGIDCEPRLGICPCDWLVTKQLLRQCSSPTFNCQRNEGAITNDEKAHLIQPLAVQCTKFIVYGLVTPTRI